MFSFFTTAQLCFIGLLFFVLTFSVLTRKLTFAASLVAGVLAVLIFAATEVKGASILCCFFILSVWATAYKKNRKAKLHPLMWQPNGRSSKQVLANGGIAGILSLCILLYPARSTELQVMMAASLAAALADTLSSELGMVYGRRFYHIVTFRRDQNGLDGVISIEGTLIGAAGATLIAVLYTGFHHTALYIACAGVMGNFVDSLLGAAFERKQLLGNNMVNFLNTLFAALTGGLLYWLF